MFVAWLLLTVGGKVSTAPPLIDQLRSTLAAEGIDLEIASGCFERKGDGYKITGQAPTANEVDKYLPLFLHEWQLYPPSIFPKSRTKHLLLCKGFALNGQIRAAAPAFDLDTMVYDVTLGADFPAYERAVIHHEFFHMLDQRMKLLYTDPDWKKLNPSGFTYGSGGAKMRENGAGDLRSDLPGFLTRYATSAMEEDKAELFAHLIVNTDFVRKVAASDNCVAKKIELLKSRLAGFEPKMNEDFWKQIVDDASESKAWLGKGAEPECPDAWPASVHLYQPKLRTIHDYGPHRPQISQRHVLE